jgi:hypothetical protein
LRCILVDVSAMDVYLTLQRSQRWPRADRPPELWIPHEAGAAS